MTRYDLSESFIGLNGESIKGSNMSVLLSDVLASNNKLNARKSWAWAQSLFNEGFVEVDDVDKKILVDFIESCDQLPAITKAQLLQKFS